jgi:hypothetical protein
VGARGELAAVWAVPERVNGLLAVLHAGQHLHMDQAQCASQFSSTALLEALWWFQQLSQQPHRAG